jgi:hypothetical protein
VGSSQEGANPFSSFLRWQNKNKHLNEATNHQLGDNQLQARRKKEEG